MPDISESEKITKILSSSVFDFDRDRFKQILTTEGIYGRRFARYLLFKLDVLFSSADNRLQVPSQMSVEHIMPQNPESNSQWCKDFTSDERINWTDRLGNLVLISRRKNSAQGRLDFKDKKEKYFKNNVETFPNSVRAMQANHWDMARLEYRHQELVKMLCSN